MARLAFCDYHNMIAILEKYEHNTDFHQIVDFVEASHLRYALTINPTVYVSYIRQFWSTARIETTDEGTKILATIDGKLRTISESSIRINLKLRDKAGISSLSDTELFENLTLMGYNILPNQKFSFQKDEPTSPIGDDSQGEACPTISGLEVEQDRENITKTSILTSDSTPRQEEMASKITAQDLEISTLKARIKHQEDRDRGDDDPSGEDSTIKGRSECSPAAEVATVSIPPTGEIPTISVPTGSGMIPTASPIYTTATESTPYIRRKGKEKMVEFDTPKKKKLQEHINIQVAREMEEQMVREDQRRNEQIERDAEIARIHAEEELQTMVDGLDRNNETIAKYLQGYEQFAAELSIGRRIELINDLVKYQDNFAKVLKYQIQQRKPLSKKQQNEFYMSMLKSHSEEGERFKRKGLSLEQESAKKVKTSKEVLEEDLKAMMQLVPVEEVYVEALQLWALVKETLNIRQAASDKEKELWVELKRLYEPDVEDQL
nr:hypothetical protein [Tanacetum cinerariifolium]